jgi:hypothetical protein
MRRREFILVIFVARRVGLLAVRAEPAIPLIGFLVPNPVVAAPPHLFAAFRRGLADWAT